MTCTFRNLQKILLLLLIFAIGSTLSRACADTSIELLRIAATPDVGESVALPLLEAFLKLNYSSELKSKKLIDNGATEWRLATPDGEAFVPVVGIVRENKEPFDIVKN